LGKRIVCDMIMRIGNEAAVAGRAASIVEEIR
jgi:hypothetical protein